MPFYQKMQSPPDPSSSVHSSMCFHSLHCPPKVSKIHPLNGMLQLIYRKTRDFVTVVCLFFIHYFSEFVISHNSPLLIKHTKEVSATHPIVTAVLTINKIENKQRAYQYSNGKRKHSIHALTRTHTDTHTHWSII